MPKHETTFLHIEGHWSPSQGHVNHSETAGWLQNIFAGDITIQIVVLDFQISIL